MGRGRRKNENPATARRILAAAEQQFAAQGIEGARTDEIATAARANKAMLYNYFGDKRRLHRTVLENLLRIGRRAIVTFPNFGFWRMRLQLLVGGHMPRTENLPATWYDTPNIHFCTIKDFVQLCDEINVKMERAVALDLYGRPVPLNLPWWVWNMFGEQGVFLLSRGAKAK